MVMGLNVGSTRVWVAVVMAVGLALGSARSAQGAACQGPGRLSCPPNRTLVRLDTRECKPNKFRSAATIKRACCRNSTGKVVCKKFPKCPKQSCS